MDNRFSDLHNQGFDLGKSLENGDADNAKKGYDALILKIQDETKGQPDETERRVNAVNSGMAEANPTDVKSPGNGTDHGFYIYWNTEKLVTEANDKVNAFCRGHDNCVALNMSQLGGSAASFEYSAQMNVASIHKDNQDLDKFLAQTNDWLYKQLPDGLERYTFKDDFNRRRSKSALEAVMDDSLSVVIKERGK